MAQENKPARYEQPSTETLDDREDRMIKIYCMIKKLNLNQFKLKLMRDFIKFHKEEFVYIEKLMKEVDLK